MLILSRKVDEKIVLGENANIVITAVGIRGGKMRIGIEAPKECPVHRLEVWEAIQGNKPGGGENT